MSYRLNGVDPFFRASIGALLGWQRNQPITVAIMLKRIGVSSWQGLHVIDNGGATNFTYPMELNPANVISTDFSTANPFQSVQAFNNTVDFMNLVIAWDGTQTAGHVDYRWKIGANAWGSETATSGGSNASAAGAGYRHLIGNEAGLGDDANFDVVCVGAIKSKLTQAAVESLDQLSFSTWQSVFTGPSAWLIGFETIAAQLDRTGNGGNELSRSAGITLQADPPGWSWGGGGGSVGISLFGVRSDCSFVPSPTPQPEVFL